MGDRIIWVLVLIGGIQASVTAGAAERDSAGRPTAFLKTHCERCHGWQAAESGLRLDKLGPVDGDDTRQWLKVLERVTLREMPPESEPQPTQAELQPVVVWLTDEFSRRDRAAMTRGQPALLPTLPRLDRPHEGNRVPHDILFHPGDGTRVEAPPRIWLRSPESYVGLVGDLGAKNAPGINQPFTTAPGEGFKDFASVGRVDEATTAQLMRNARSIVSYWLRHRIVDGRVKAENNAVKVFVELLDPQSPPSEKQLAAAIQEAFKRTLRRPATEEEVARHAEFFARTRDRAGQAEAATAMLVAVLLRPDVTFRFEMGEEPTGGPLVRLTQREIALALASALTDRQPDAALLSAVEKGGLGTREQVMGQARRMLDEPKIEKPRVLRFFRQYFGYDDAPEVFKDKKENEDHHAGMLVSDTDQLVLWVLAQDRDVLQTLLTTNKSFVNYKASAKAGQPARRFNDHAQMRSHTSYNLPRDWMWTAEQPVELPESQRCGLLTQPSWLVAHSSNFDNHAIRRGKWIRERLLGGHIPDLPITVDAALSDDRSLTLRERMQKTRDEYCWQCHHKMDPLGMPFEMFDHFGRFRTEECGQPVDATGRVDHSHDNACEGDVKDALEMIRRLSASPRVRQVFVRHVFRFFMGRNETVGDGPTLVAMDAAYRDGGGSFQELLITLFGSESFLYRGVVRPTEEVRK